MEIEVFRQIGNTYDYESVDIIDSFKSLIETLNFFTTNTFNLKVPISNKVIQLLIPDTCLLIDGCFYYIDFVKNDEDDNGLLDVKGKSLGRKANGRIVKTNWNQTGKPGQIAFNLLDTYVVDSVEYLSLAPLPEISAESIRYQNSYGDVLEEIVNLCETYEFGFKETPVSIYEPSAVIEFYKVRDVSDLVELSIENENLLNESYENSNFDEATVAYVLGEGEGTDRKRVIVNDHLQGMDRKEIYVDARDLQQNPDGGPALTDNEYRELLKRRGLSKLSERQRILQLNGTVNVNDKLYKFGKDYDLGDRISVKSEKFQMKYTAVLTSVQKTWDENGFHIDLIFGKESPTVFDILKRK